MRGYNGSSMRRGMTIAAFALILSVPLWAQHGGGGGHGGGFGGGGHAGSFGGGGHVGGFSGGTSGRGFSGNANVHAYSGPLSSASRGVSHLPPTFGFNHPPTGAFTPPTSPLVRQPFASNGFSRNGFVVTGRGHGGVNVRIRSYPYWGWGYGWGYPYWGLGYWDPWWSWWWNQDNSGYDNSGYDNDAASAEQMNEDSLRQQQMLQQEQMDGDQDAYYRDAYNQGFADAQVQNQQSRPNSYSNVNPPLDPGRMQELQHEGQRADSILQPTVLVFRDQHKQEIENYAIVDDTLWDFSPQQTLKIPLAELDIPATIKANQDRGITFNVPSSDEGQ
jgi:hypothetical protein